MSGVVVRSLGSVVAPFAPAGAHWLRSACASPTGATITRPHTIRIVAASPSSFAPRVARGLSRTLITDTVSADRRLVPTSGRSDCDRRLAAQRVGCGECMKRCAGHVADTVGCAEHPAPEQLSEHGLGHQL